MENQALIGRMVLVVEDNFLLAMELAGMLESAGAKVVGPVSGVQAALEVLSLRPDAATLDVQLGEETSFSIADELANQGIPFIFATGTADGIPPAHASWPVCIKPLSEAAVIQALAGVMAGPTHDPEGYISR